jgi:class 3 adenylate cyclase
MGIHTGEVALVEGEYLGIDVNLAARIAAAAHGGEIIVSAATKSLVADGLPPGLSLRALGDHRLKDFPRPLPLFRSSWTAFRRTFRRRERSRPEALCPSH